LELEFSVIFFYLLITVMPLIRHPLWERYVGDVTIIKCVGLLCLLYAGVHVALRRRLPAFFSTWQARLFILFFLISAASYLLMGSRTDLEFNPILSYSSFLVLLFITLAVVDSLSRLRWVLLVAIGSEAFASLYVLREWQKYHNVYAQFRPGFVVGDPNYFCVSAVLCLPIASYLLLGEQRLLQRLYCLGCLLLTLAAVTLSASRGGLIGLIVSFFFAIWHSRRRVRNFVLVMCLLVPMTIFSPTSPLRRLLRPNYSAQQSTENHEQILVAGLRMIAAHPLVGVGLGNFKLRMSSYADPDLQQQFIAHNSYLEVAAEMGVPALMVFLGILFFTFRTLTQLRVRLAASEATLLLRAVQGIQAGMAGSCISLFFVSGQYQKLNWFIIFLVMCLPPLEKAVREGEKAHVPRRDTGWASRQPPRRREPARERRLAWGSRGLSALSPLRAKQFLRNREES
jgi:O-antigen ligase